MDNGTVTYSRLGNNGRLCNSMFQIAGTISYAMEHGKDFAFPEWRYSKYMKKSFPVGAVPVDRITNEPTFHYTPIPKIDGNVDLGGYYQSSKYFKKHIKEILPYITLNSTYTDMIRDKYDDVLKKKTCSIHVRHGDYLLNPVHREYHGVLSLEYYGDAMQKLYGNSYEDITFLIFSDDMEWCKENFHLPNQVFVEGEEDVIDLFIGSYCKDHILANSSFSWWMAYLTPHRDTRVVAPKDWFWKANLDTKDLYCEGWMKV